MSTKPSKPRSPATPSRALGDAIADVKKLYEQYSHGKFAKAEIASALGVSATSGPFAGRLFTLRAYGLIIQNGNDYTVSSEFIELNSTATNTAKFKAAALKAIRNSDTFKELLDEFGTKLPSVAAIATRLETQKRFNAGPAKNAANVLEKSLRYAGVLDASNNILPIREDAANGGAASDPPGGGGQGSGAAEEEPEDDLPTDMLSMEIPVGDDRKVAIRYPRDLSSAEAKKVGNVLAAVVS